ncbi:hypothetical protein ETB97_000435 [Aspergillus alliaceus]|uniref:Fatty acyl-CoA reductase n=1 Tax=Petromyces alliaceus TaxID=209559 RepID=A0A8H6E7D2_PETAA|nr:hypothetical protein ETB97_000435 [Aspergillus burnettii]
MGGDQTANKVDWYRGQIIFLTGATGSLGECLLYKLAVTEKVCVLCRGSVRKAMEKWELSMSEQVDEIFDSAKAHCMVGEMTRPDFGLRDTDLRTLQCEVTAIVHAAANISLTQDLPTAIRQDFLPVMTLIEIITRSKKSRDYSSFLQSAPAFSCPRGLWKSVCTKYPMMNTHPKHRPKDSRRQLRIHIRRGSRRHSLRQNTSQSVRYLLQTLGSRFSLFAHQGLGLQYTVHEPFPFYGPRGAIPAHTYLHLLLGEKGFQTFNDVQKFQRGLVVEEIPVDLAANTCLLHLMQGTRGVVHAGAELYAPLTVREYSAICQTYMPKLIKCEIQMFRSERFKNTAGPIGLSIQGHDFKKFMKSQVEKQSLLVMESINRAGLEKEGAWESS